MNTPLVSNAREYLLGFDGVSNALIDKHLNQWKGARRKSRKAIFRSMIRHAQNRQMMPKVIGEVDDLRETLFGFNPDRVSETFEGPHDILRAIARARIRPRDKLSGDLWQIYAKSIKSCADFMATFSSASAFHQFVESFYVNEHSRLALPLLLKAELDGFGFALACDFLKENGYSGFVKPDVHLKDICRAAGITSAASDYVAFKDVVRYCTENHLVPYEFDKLIWLVGSGRFYQRNLYVPTSKAAFIQRYLVHGG